MLLISDAAIVGRRLFIFI